jgi:GntR family transcriptional regulator, rspAB operon transcriptional repressor
LEARPTLVAARRAAVARHVGRLTLAEQAYESIKSRILSLELHPGQFLTEAALCELTGIGRMPVHQATHRLQSEGLIEVIARKGLVIRMDSLNDVLELLEARVAFEPNVAALAAERISKEQCTQLEKLLRRSRELVSQSQRQAFGVIDRAFHGIVTDAAGNKILADTLRPLQQRSELFWRLRIMPEEGLEVTQREHEAVLGAILRHDAEGARKAMQAHLVSLHNRILQAASHRRKA